MSTLGSIGRYEVTEELGRGSMGIVCLAHDPVMDREVAIKTILLPHGVTAGRRAEYLERFLREAQAAGSLSHPGIVTVYDFEPESSEKLPFIAMEYVPGRSLHELIAEEGALNTDWALAVVETLADALQVAHEAGVVHRDLKTANILVREHDGVAKIADFGVARVDVSELTGLGETYGSPAYTAPECLRGEPADARADLFSLAVILYEALAGARPFDGDGFASVCRAILDDEPPSIRDADASLTPAFDRFFAKALAKDPAERFASAAAFRDALDAVRHEQLLFATGAATMMMPAQAAVEAEPEAPAEDVVRRTPPLLLASWAVGSIAAAALAARIATPDRPVVRTPAPSPTVEAAPRAPIEWPRLPPLTDPAALPTSSAEDPRAVECDPDTFFVLPEWAPASPPPRAATAKPTPKPPAGREPKPATPPVEPTAPVVATTVAPVPIAAKVAPPEPAVVTVVLRNNFRAGSLRILADGDEVLAVDLRSEASPIDRALGKRDAVEHEIEIPAGAGVLEIFADNHAKDRTHDARVDLDLLPGERRTLTIVVGKTFGRRLTATLE